MIITNPKNKHTRQNPKNMSQQQSPPPTNTNKATPKSKSKTTTQLAIRTKTKPQTDIPLIVFKSLRRKDQTLHDDDWLQIKKLCRNNEKNTTIIMRCIFKAALSSKCPIHSCKVALILTDKLIARSHTARKFVFEHQLPNMHKVFINVSIDFIEVRSFLSKEVLQNTWSSLFVRILVRKGFIFSFFVSPSIIFVHHSIKKLSIKF